MPAVSCARCLDKLKRQMFIVSYLNKQGLRHRLACTRKCAELIYESTIRLPGAYNVWVQGGEIDAQEDD